MPVFATCPPCGHQWVTRQAFLADSNVAVTGYKVDYDDLLSGTFLFRHACGGALSLSARRFNGLYEGPIFENRVAESDDCPEYCLYQERLDRCHVRCECAYVRNIIDIIRKWPKDR